MTLTGVSSVLSGLSGVADTVGFTVGNQGEYHFHNLQYATTPGATAVHVEWAYDALGRQIAKTVYDGTGTVTGQSRYRYDGWQLVQEVAPNTGVITATYVHGPGYVDDIVVQVRNGQTYYHHTDQQYSTIAVTDATGAPVERYTYDPFGSPTIRNGAGTPITATTISNDILYTGRPWDPQLNLYDYRTRHYNPMLGRFTTPDPANDPANLGSPFTYTANNPWAFVDPFGLYNIWAGIGGGFRVIGSIAEGTVGLTAVLGASTVTAASVGVGSPVSVPAAIGGAALTVHAFDSFSTGLREVWNGETYRSQTSQAVAAVTGSGTAGEIVDMGVGTVGTSLVGAAINGTQSAEVAVAARSARSVTTATKTGSIEPRLLGRVEAWRAYKAQGGDLDMRRWVQSTQRQYGGVSGGYASGYGKWVRSVGSTHGNSRLSPRPATLYRMEDDEGNLIRWGVTQDLAHRYPKNATADMRLYPHTVGKRSDMLDLERIHVETNPGPLNFEPWAGAKAEP